MATFHLQFVAGAANATSAIESELEYIKTHSIICGYAFFDAF